MPAAALVDDGLGVRVSDNVSALISVQAYEHRNSPVRAVWRVHGRQNRRPFAKVLAERREHYMRSLRG